MKHLVLLITLFISASLSAGTKYIWAHKKPGKIETGYCLEVDEKMNTENIYKKAQNDFTKKVSLKKCKPDDKLISYFFNPNTGRCFEGDDKTSGSNYFQYVDVKKCKTAKVEKKNFTINGKYGCYEIDSKTQGVDYYKKLRPNHCLSDDTNYVWVRNGIKSGRCYSYNPETGQKLETKKDFCKPPNPSYGFTRTSAFQGYCLEFSTNPDNQYSRTVKQKNCKPKDTSFYFYKKPNEDSGKCYEVDTETKGDDYINLVESKNCK